MWESVARLLMQAIVHLCHRLFPEAFLATVQVTNNVPDPQQPSVVASRDSRKVCLLVSFRGQLLQARGVMLIIAFGPAETLA